MKHKEIAKFAGVCEKTMRDYFYEYLAGGLERVAQFNTHKNQSELMKFEELIREEFEKQPPAS